MKEGIAPGPDGFIVNFFHHFWDMVKMDVWRIVEDSKVSKRILPVLNATFLTLIPKTQGADSRDKINPIILSNVIYKIVMKVIANCLKVISNLISRLGFQYPVSSSPAVDEKTDMVSSR